jgi:hypothetical protein
MLWGLAGYFQRWKVDFAAVDEPDEEDDFF